MLKLPKTIIIYDTEFTAWEGSMDRGWSREGEYREVVEIGAIKVETNKLIETNKLDLYVRPEKNPKLSNFFITLTGITQVTLDQKGISYPEAIQKFAAWTEETPLFSFGMDHDVLRANCELLEIPFPFKEERFHNIKDVFSKYGIAADQYMSSTIVEAFGKKSKEQAHNALGDARTILAALRELAKSIQS